MILQYGTHNIKDVVDGWKPITHLDLQPGNVFLRLVRNIEVENEGEEKNRYEEFEKERSKKKIDAGSAEPGLVSTYTSLAH